MCDPISLGIAAIAVGAAGTGVSMYAAKKQGDYQGDVADYNAKVGVQQATQAIDAGNTEEQQQRTRVRQAIGSERAAMSSSGAVVDSGSFGDVLDTTVKTGELDALTIRSNAMRKAWGYQVGADMSKAEAGFARSAGTLNATGSLLSGASATFGMAAKLKKGDG